MSNRNLALARRWFHEVWNDRREATIDELLTEDSVCYGESGPICGLEEFKRRQYYPLIATFSESHLEIEDMLASNDCVVVRWNFTGKHSGDGIGETPTGTHVYFSGMTWIRFSAEGKMAEGWQCSDIPKVVKDGEPRKLAPRNGT